MGHFELSGSTSFSRKHLIDRRLSGTVSVEHNCDHVIWQTDIWLPWYLVRAPLSVTKPLCHFQEWKFHFTLFWPKCLLAKWFLTKRCCARGLTQVAISGLYIKWLQLPLEWGLGDKKHTYFTQKEKRYLMKLEILLQWFVVLSNEHC